MEGDVPLFKVPVGTPPKSRRRVLEEETYLNTMGDIIERDFFPDLKDLRVLQEKLDAAPKAYGSDLPQCDSPATFETPKRTDNNGSSTVSHGDQESIRNSLPTAAINVKAGSKISRLTLDQFVEHYTTEDDESFKEKLKENDEKYKKMYGFMFNEEQTVNDTASRLIVPSIEEQAKGVPKTLALDTWTYRNKNELMFAPEGVANQSSSNEGRLISYKNTSLREVPFDSKISTSQLLLSKESQARAQQGKIGIDGKILVDSERSAGIYNFVRTPSPMPGVAESPLMTWGEIGGTPFRLDGGSTPSFHIQQVPKREKIAFALADKVTESHRDVKRKAADAARPPRCSPSPGRSSIFGSMSPAAQRLATNAFGRRPHSGTHSPFHTRPSPSTPRSLMSPSTQRLTPNLLRNKPGSGIISNSRSPFVTHPHGSVKSQISESATVPSVSESSANFTDITDNLLSLSKDPLVRPRAEDFF